MKTSFPNPYARGQKLVRWLLAFSIAAALAGLLLCQEGTRQQFLFMLLSIAFMVGVIVVIVRDCRCPACGKRIISGVLVLSVCPRCKRSLYTGDKMKKTANKTKK